MPLVDKKYQSLTLLDTYINDPLLMALAWKKSHQYIRTTNWYADHFDLDLSALNLVENCDKWVEDIQSDKLSFKDLQLVPAPKACEWEFGTNETLDHDECVVWRPADSESVSLRPLAHISIREQTLMTLVVMCLANDVETLQGDPSTEYGKVHDRKVASYGNRLYCKYVDGKADHSYGSTTLYSKYFIDYRRFLERPYYFAQQARDNIDDDNEVFLVELDLAKFFDLINRAYLIKKIKSFYQNDEANSHKNFDRLLEAFEEWSWTEQAKINFKNLCASDDVKEAPMGLPQGLVAAGFLSNIYLLDFDALLKKYIGEYICNDKLKLIDYCRYVDDIRLVISASKDSSIKELKSQVDTFIEDILKGEKPLEDLGLKINKKKTKVDIYRGKAIGVSDDLNKIQSRLSGPIPFDEANDQLKQLESLLSLKDMCLTERDPSDCKINKLAEIEKNYMNVRGDTMKRFAANKISKVLKEIRHFTSHQINSIGRPIPGSWDYQQEHFARRLISYWSDDPSLVLLLKKGLELFPSTRLLNPVLEQLLARLNEKNMENYEKIQSISRYCIAEIFRHAATIIHSKDKVLIPVHADIETFFERLQHEAIVYAAPTNDKDFDVLTEQARFLLLVRLDTCLESINGNANYDLIFKLISGFRTIKLPDSEKFDPSRIASCILLSRQLTDNDKPLLRAVASLLDSNTTKVQTKILEKLAAHDYPLFKKLTFHSRAVQSKWVKEPYIKILIRQQGIDQKPLLKPLDKISGKQSLLRLIKRPDNPLANELMTLKLMKALLDNKTLQERIKPNLLIDLTKTKVEFSDYTIPPKFKAFDTILKVDVELVEPTHKLSQHFTSSDSDTLLLQRIAICLRSVLIGDIDWTGFGRELEKKIGYKGIKSNADKRMLGLMTTPYEISGEAAQISHWLTTLLSKLLIWPGITVYDSSYDWPKHWTVDDVQKLVSNRLGELRENYCKQSNMPGITEKVSLDWDENRKALTVAMVQSKLPAKKDFDKHGLLLTAPQYRSKHRRHIAEVAHLVCKYIDAQRTDDTERDKKKQQIDLIVWPELSVHKDDIDILLALSRKTHAIIFAGLTFVEQSGIKGPNNCGIWIVPPKHGAEQKEMTRFQGKFHMMSDEKGFIEPWRPYQFMLELIHPKFPNKPGFIITGSICFDATDIALSTDLRDKSSAYVVSALNQDVNTFDTMVDALHYHMFQPVILVNSGEFGGSYAKAPYSEPFHRLLSHSHGNDQVTINTFEMNMFDFRRDNLGAGLKSGKDTKATPAGVIFHN